MTNIAMENDPFIDDFPSYKPPFIRDFPVRYVKKPDGIHTYIYIYNYIYIYLSWVNPRTKWPFSIVFFVC